MAGRPSSESLASILRQLRRLPMRKTNYTRARRSQAVISELEGDDYVKAELETPLVEFVPAQKARFDPEEVAERAGRLLAKALECAEFSGEKYDELRLLVRDPPSAPPADVQSDFLSAEKLKHPDIRAWDEAIGLLQPDMPDRQNDPGRLQSWISACGPVADLLEAGAAGGEERTAKEDRDAPRYEFRKDGAFYRVRFDGESGTIPGELLGTGYIATLLRQPNKAVSATAIRGAVESSDTGRSDRKDNQETLRSYQKRLTELQAEREQAEARGETLVTAEIDDEKEKIALEVRKLTGLGGIARHPRDSDRVAITNAVNVIKQKCRTAWKLSRLADHLDAYLSTGRNCSYRPPAPAPDWNF